MLAKLCKYEIKSIGRSLLPLYIAVLAASFISGVMGMSSVQNLMNYNSVLGGVPYVIINMLYFGLNVALFVVTLLIIIQRFYKGLLCDEGYLMFTLPVKPWQLIASKGLVATVMSVLSGVVSFTSIMILAAFYGELTLPAFTQITAVFGELWQIAPSWPLLALECIALLLLCIFGALCMLYASMSIGHLAKRHRVALSFTAWLGLMVASNYATALVIELVDRTGLDVYLTTMLHNAQLTGVGATHLLFVSLIVYSAISLTIWFVISNVILSRKLNLE